MSRRKRPTLNDEIRRLQQAQALLIAIQHAANYDVDFSVSDTLLVVLALIGESLDGLDRMEVSLFRADAFKATRGSNMALEVQTVMSPLEKLESALGDTNDVYVGGAPVSVMSRR